MNKLKLLQEWQTTIHSSDKALAALDKVVGANDGPLKQSIWTMQATYTRAISLIVGDEADWLEWFACENHMGKKGLAASTGTGKPLKPIKTLAQLLAVIEGAE
jgi:hypothetical protein